MDKLVPEIRAAPPRDKLQEQPINRKAEQAQLWTRCLVPDSTKMTPGLGTEFVPIVLLLVCQISFSFPPQVYTIIKLNLASAAPACSVDRMGIHWYSSSSLKATIIIAFFSF